MAPWHACSLASNLNVRTPDMSRKPESVTRSLVCHGKGKHFLACFLFKLGVPSHTLKRSGTGPLIMTFGNEKSIRFPFVQQEGKG